jgi:hypothetical protein
MIPRLTAKPPYMERGRGGGWPRRCPGGAGHYEAGKPPPRPVQRGRLTGSLSGVRSAGNLMPPSDAVRDFLIGRPQPQALLLHVCLSWWCLGRPSARHRTTWHAPAAKPLSRICLWRRARGRDQRLTVGRSIRCLLLVLVSGRWRPPTASILLPREGQEAKSVEGICREGLGGPALTGRPRKLSDRSMQPLATVRARIGSGVPGVRGHSRVASSVPILAPLSATSPSAVETHPAPGQSRTNDLRSGTPAAGCRAPRPQAACAASARVGDGNAAARSASCNSSDERPAAPDHGYRKAPPMEYAITMTCVPDGTPRWTQRTP